MTLQLAIFPGQGGAKDLTTFVNDNAIAKDNLEFIQLEDGFWFLFYWA